MAQEKDKSNTHIIVAVISASATICAACIAGVFTFMDKFPRSGSPTVIVLTQEALPGSTQPDHLVQANTPVALPTNTPRPLPTGTPWTAGVENPSHPHVIASSEEKTWEPDYGYRWLNPDDEKDLEVVPIIEDVTVDHNTVLNGDKGMTIHLKFTLDDYKDIPCQAVAYFYFSNPEKPLTAGNSHYTSSDGQVTASSDFKPGFPLTSYEDLQLFLPYSALNMPNDVKEVNLKFRVVLFEKPDNDLATSDWLYFKYTNK